MDREDYLLTLRDLIYDNKFKEAQTLKDKMFAEAINKNKIKVMTIQDLKNGSIFQMEGLNTNGDTVICNAELIRYNGMGKYIIYSDGITLLYDGDQEIL